MEARQKIERTRTAEVLQWQAEGPRLTGLLKQAAQKYGAAEAAASELLHIAYVCCRFIS